MSIEQTIHLALHRGKDDEKARCLAWIKHFIHKHEMVRKAMTWGGQKYDEETMTIAENVESEMRALATAIERGREPPETTL